ncbi:helix-turn-helix domain containing protein [Cytobacillus kochii]|uniref:TetR/AcrR family transcriptional regulator n=1 Tax=Cytobacillus kochii TaxID=859143 RepID=UPI002E21F6C2|nr:helix-turn-helix domain containing protein [Cytobacillus kochii]
MECSIETIAEVGYAQTSLGQIAKRANISKVVISYRFTNKKEIFAQIPIEYYKAWQSFITPQLEAQKRNASGVFLTFIAENRKHVFAVIETISNQRGADGKLLLASEHDETSLLPIENILTLGIKEGLLHEFNRSSARVMALTIRNAIDGFTIELMRQPHLDIKEFTRGLVIIFDASTKSNCH